MITDVSLREISSKVILSHSSSAGKFLSLIVNLFQPQFIYMTKSIRVKEHIYLRVTGCRFVHDADSYVTGRSCSSVA